MRKFLNKYNINIVLAKKEKLRKRNEKIAAMAKKRNTLKEIEEKFGVSHNVVKKILCSCGISQDYYSKIREKRDEQICKMAKLGKYNSVAIAKKFGLDYNYILSILLDNGIHITDYCERKYGPDVYKPCKKDNTKRNKEICKMAKDFYPLKDIAEKYDLTTEFVMRILHKNNIYLRKMDIKDETAKLYKQGLSAEKIAKKLHRTEKTINNYLQQMKLYHGPKEKWKNYIRDNKKKIIKDYRDGKTIQYIVSTYNISSTTLYKNILKDEEKRTYVK